MTTIKIIALINIICFVFIESQRGGGSSGGGSSSSSRSYSSHHYYGSSTVSTPWGWSDTLILGGIILAIIPIGICAIKSEQKKQAERRKQIKQIFNQYEGKSQANMCTLDQSQKTRAIDWFMISNWVIQFRLRDMSYQGKCQIKIKDLKNRTPNIYDLQIQGTDDIGTSKFTGVLMFQNDYLGMILQKTYNDKTKAGQTGQFKILLYQGVQQGETFVGSWSYKGFEGNPSYSGDWRMVHN